MAATRGRDRLPLLSDYPAFPGRPTGTPGQPRPARTGLGARPHRLRLPVPPSRAGAAPPLAQQGRVGHP
ncbi:hypothetical protein J116_026160 [Streptomyces thermolilacinus SPC6]|uniref:Uncharacterized protein n=1 Tax=Streptomyces thermolilacinus SPC6 TaxID=1306406 RepID=A0A1D3DYL1_9ACTN|nr:hypothetical protein J116_026160 [Streptomyces thermolilacinus SPC6]